MPDEEGLMMKKTSYTLTMTVTHDVDRATVTISDDGLENIIPTRLVISGDDYTELETAVRPIMDGRIDAALEWVAEGIGGDDRLMGVPWPPAVEPAEDA